MKHCTAHVKYLIAIKELMDTNETVRCVNISRHLGVSRPSVSKMLRCLVNSGLVCDDFCNNVTLTAEGKVAVNEIFDVFNEVYIFFRKFLRLPPDEAHSHSVTFLTEYPQDTCQRLKAIVKRTMSKQDN